jgi:hypothetical protein
MDKEVGMPRGGVPQRRPVNEMTPDEAVMMLENEARNAGVSHKTNAWAWDLMRREMERDPKLIPHVVAGFRRRLAEEVAG